jgi:hypothetical protein
MRRSIFKYPLMNQPIQIHRGSKALHTGEDENGLICLWAEVDTSMAFESRSFVAYPTGKDVLPTRTYFQQRYVGTTIRSDGTVWHIYEVIDGEDAHDPTEVHETPRPSGGRRLNA